MINEQNYWQNKISHFLNFPLLKALEIPGLETRVAEIANLIHQPAVDKDKYLIAQMIAAGLTGNTIPKHTEDIQNDTNDIAKYIVLTHPLAKNSVLKFGVPENLTTESIYDSLLDLLKTDLGVEKKYEEPEQLKFLYFYLFFALKKRLRNTNSGGLGGLWDLLPADTRMPDHSIWHHCGLTSAIGSAMADDPNQDVSLVDFAITPVQPFIAKARKLRDSWTASVILSYLSFTGIRFVMEELGPDHIMYPSLHDQSLVENWLEEKFQLSKYLTENDIIEKHIKKSKNIASFPNKFVFLCSTSKVKDITDKIQKAIQDKWLHNAGRVRDVLKEKTKAGKIFTDLFDHQISDYWQYSWASAKLIGFQDEEMLKEVLPKEKWQKESQTLHKCANMYGPIGEQTARLYGTTHSLVQGLLASTKLKPMHKRKPQEGEKCPLCGEHEALHNFADAGNTSVKKYDDTIKEFWDKLRTSYKYGDSNIQIGDKERLCAICATKRFLPLVVKVGEPLYEVFGEVDNFPSTTELAATTYVNRLKEERGLSEEEEKKLYEYLQGAEVDDKDDEYSEAIKYFKSFETEGIKYTNRDKYYALLLMDGDKMGALINGDTINATWGDIMNPELRKQFDSDTFNTGSHLKKDWLYDKRTINPAVHAAISDSLNSFARFCVAPVIREAHGRLIYAGGDDVCAVLPLATALETVEKISIAYRMKFVKYNKEGAVDINSATADSGKLGLHLGDAPGISISAALVIAHHKEPLREVMRDAHAVLDGVAKKNTGRNALAIRLKKRAGCDRDIAFRWDKPNPFLPTEKLIASFKYVMTSVTNTETSASLIYKMGYLMDAVQPLVTTKADMNININKVVKIFAYEVRHSGIPGLKEQDELQTMNMAARLAGLCIIKPSTEPDWFNPEGPVIGRFLALKEVK